MSNDMMGVVIAKVTNNDDPEELGRIEVEFPWLDDDVPRWLPVASPMAGPNMGLFMMPEPEHEVLVAFDHGNFDHGYIVGFLWNHLQQPPMTVPAARGIYSREGHALQLLDAEPVNGNHGAVVLNDAHGNAVVMTNGVLSIFSRGVLTIDAPAVVIKGRTVNPAGGAI